MISKEKKAAIMKEYARTEGDTGFVSYTHLAKAVRRDSARIPERMMTWYLHLN